MAISASCCWNACTASRFSHIGFISLAAYSDTSGLIKTGLYPAGNSASIWARLFAAASIDSDLPAAQQPSWPDRGALDAAVAQLATYPPLVFAGECDNLRDRMAAASVGVNAPV